MATQPLDAEIEKQKLRDFVSSIPFMLEEFVEDGLNEGYAFDYSFSSIDDVERYIADNRELMAWANKSEQAKWQRMYAWAYLGETFRKQFGGEWLVSLDEPGSVNYGQWVIKGFDAVGVEFDPLGVLQGYLLRGKPGSLSRALQSIARPSPLDLSHLPTEEA